MVKVITQDKETIEVNSETVNKITLLKNLVEDLGESTGVIPLQNVTKKTFNKILEYFKENVDKNYFDIDLDFLFEVIIASNYLDIEDLLDEGCKKVACFIKDKPVEEIREILGIE